MSTILGNGISIRGGNSRAGAKVTTTLNDDGTQNVFITDNVNTAIDTAKSIFSVSYNKVLVPLVGGSTPSGKLEFTYTGEYNERDDGVVELLTSGELMFNKTQKIDIFCVGGGGAGGYMSNPNISTGAGGGGGGYTNLLTGYDLLGGVVVTIGEGSSTQSTSSSGLQYGGTTSFGTILSAAGGQSAYRTATSEGTYAINGGRGGSGGGTGSTTTKGPDGGYDGSDGELGTITVSTTTYNPTAGVGQGRTTREFGESTGKLYAGGGGGGIRGTNKISTGGTGGGGNGGYYGSSSSDSVKATAGAANTGGGGGGGASYQGSGVNGANGGSGIVCIRLSSASGTEMPLTGELTVGNLVTYDGRSWRVVNNIGTKWYLASENITEKTEYGAKTFADSTIAKLCTIYLNTMTADALKYMVEINNSKIFIPYQTQAEGGSNGGFTYYATTSNRICKYNGSATEWWTASPYSSSYGGSNAYYVSTSGSITYSITSNSYGFRPHICIDTSLSGSATKETIITAGTYTFNHDLTSVSSDVTGPFAFSTNGVNMIKMVFTTKGILQYWKSTTNYSEATYNSNSWNATEFRTVILPYDATVDTAFYDWFTSNAILSSSATKTITAGKYVFNDTLTNPSSEINASITFQSGAATYTGITKYTDNIMDYITLSGTNQLIISAAGSWGGTGYKILAVQSDATVSSDFYTWFTANTTKSS